MEAVNDRFRRKEVHMPKPSVMATIAWSLSRSEFLVGREGEGKGNGKRRRRSRGRKG